MKKRKALSVLICALALVGAFTLVAGAIDTLETISATLNRGITIKYEGEVQTMKDGQGSTIYPITYNNTNYLPVRAVADMLGLEVGWDSATQTITLGASETGTDMVDSFKPYTAYTTDPSATLYRNPVVLVQSGDGRTQDVGGETINHWLNLRNYNDIHSSYIPDSGASAGVQGKEITCSFNLGGKYSSLSFKVYTNTDTTLKVLGDNDTVLGEYTLTGGQVPQTITIDLAHTTQLTFIRGADPVGQVANSTYLFNAVLK